jgi:hypothetical protein
MKRTLLLLAALSACGGGASPSDHGGQSSLINRTFAGQNKCNPKNADRPFIVEWDATDQSSFQARAAKGVVFVKYEGCDLQVLDGCAVDSERGKLGGYNPVEWTSGQLETVDIADQNDLYAKLPLGAATLGGRVEQGEKFHMEYFVSGTRTATREHQYRSAISKIDGCTGATHFVYGYNLGAFALGSASSLKQNVGGSYFGFGAGGSRASASQADKKGGELSACKGSDVKEVDRCKVPIRLTLREISGGDDPAASAAKAPEGSDAANNLAGSLKAESDKEKAAAQHAAAAVVKRDARDGAGCLAEWDEHDRLDPRPEGLSTNPASGQNAGRRAQCIMLDGKCDAGKDLFRKAWTTSFPNDAPEHAQGVLDATIGQYCQGGKMSPQQEVLAAKQQLMSGAMTGPVVDSATCMNAYQTLKKRGAIVAGSDNSDSSKVTAVSLVATAPLCFGRAGDCATAYKVYVELTKIWRPDQDEKYMRAAFDGTVKMCKGK